MKAKIKLVNPNACGANSYEEFPSITALKTMLNEMLYYSGEVYLNVPSLSNYVKYSETNDVQSLLQDVNFFDDEYLEVIPTFE